MLVLMTDLEDKQKRGGQIQLILGPMFSGKTTELMRRLKRYQFANHRCLIVKYERDSRYDEKNIATHDRQTMNAVSCTNLSCLIKAGHVDDDVSVIGIDEGQFFPDTVSFAEEMANMGKTVIVAALDGTFQRKEFGSILQLIPLAESVIKLTAVCMICFEEASFTKRIGQEKELEVIGGAEKYMAVCRKCFMLSSTTTTGDNKVTSNGQSTTATTTVVANGHQLTNGVSNHCLHA